MSARRWTALSERVGGALAERRLRDLVVFGLFSLLTVLWFHRLIGHLGNAVLVGPNDASYGIRAYWGAEYAGKTPFNFHRDLLNGAPEGLPFSSAVQAANALIPGTIWLLHFAVGWTAASNLFLLGGFVLTGFSTYLLLDRVGLHPVGCIYAGYALAFNPWMIERAYAGHSGFMQAWVFPLEVGALLYMHRRRTALSAVLAGLSVILAFYAGSYYGLLAGLIFVVFWVVDLAKQSTWGERLWSFTLADIALVTAVVAFIPALVAWHFDRSAVALTVSNPLQHLQNLGATAESYILPSVRHPLLGDITRHFDPRAADHWSENTLYLGWSLIALGVVGAVLVLRRYPDGLRSPALRYLLVSALVLAPAAFLTSLKRETSVFGVDMPMPSYLIGTMTTFWRVFARFGLLVTFALAILAALALTVAFRRTRYGLAVAAAAFSLLVFEYYNGVAPIYTFDPAPYSQWLAEQPRGIVANYPLPTDQPAALRLLANTFYQQIFNKQPNYMPFGSGYGGTREDAIRVLSRYVDAPETPGILKAQGVRYVLLHDDYYREQGVDPPAVPPGYQLVTNLRGNVRVLTLDPSVVAADLPTVLEQNAAAIALTQGLKAPTLEARGLAQAPPREGEAWTTLETSAQLELRSSDPALHRVNLLIRAQSFDEPRTLQLVAPDGTVVAEAAVGTDVTAVALQGRIDGASAEYTLRVDPPGRVELSPVAPQPLADFSVSLRDE